MSLHLWFVQWLEYYLYAGVDKFYWYDNAQTPGESQVRGYSSTVHTGLDYRESPVVYATEGSLSSITCPGHQGIYPCSRSTDALQLKGCRFLWETALGSLAQSGKGMPIHYLLFMGLQAVSYL